MIRDRTGMRVPMVTLSLSSLCCCKAPWWMRWGYSRSVPDNVTLANSAQGHRRNLVIDDADRA